MKTIGARDVALLPAAAVEPGMVTVDGIVVEVKVDRGTVWIRHRSTTYAQRTRDRVQVYGRLEDSMVEPVQAAVGKETVYSSHAKTQAMGAR